MLKLDNPFWCRIIERVNRFVVKIQIGDNYYRAHLNNTGRLEEFLIKGRKAICFKKGKLSKTDCRLFAIEERGFGALIDTQLQMKAFENSVESGLVPWLKECPILRRNEKLSTSLIDYLLDCMGKVIYLEVKSAVLREGEYAMYPDCPSLRGQKHIKEITVHVRKGGKGIILFMAALPEVDAFKPNKSADPELYRLLKEAHSSGVEVRAIGLYYNPTDSYVYLYNPDLKVDLDS
ncbi:MAG: DNA/RNA nuclease SfsA [Candidatus Aminicenantes bacterium]|nr:DNA/RNA nuclease SfsA [Candidatus Aminicenantes bacterium]